MPMISSWIQDRRNVRIMSLYNVILHPKKWIFCPGRLSVSWDRQQLSQVIPDVDSTAYLVQATQLRFLIPQQLLHPKLFPCWNLVLLLFFQVLPPKEVMYVQYTQKKGPLTTGVGSFMRIVRKSVDQPSADVGGLSCCGCMNGHSDSQKMTSMLTKNILVVRSYNLQPF